MSRPRALSLTVILALAACSPASRDDGGDALFADPGAVEVLVEEAELGDPISGRPNRFFRGWMPWRAEGRDALRSDAGGAAVQVVVAHGRARTVSLDLPSGDAVSRAAHVAVRIDGGPPSLVPLADPLSIPLPADLAPGSHRVEVLPRQPEQDPLVVLAGAVRPVADGGEARVEGADLVQSGPSVVDVTAHPDAGSVLSGEVCPFRALDDPGAGGLELTGADGRQVGTWSGRGGLLDRLRGCRRVELPPVPATGPVRVRLTAAEGARLRWRGWRWERPADRDAGPEAARPTPAAHRDPAAPPPLVVLYVMDALRADHLAHLGGPSGISPVLDRLAREGFTFRDHRSTAPNTLLSLRHLFSGRILADEEAWRNVGLRLPSLADAFRQAGYRTGLFSGNGYVDRSFGLDRGFDHVSAEALFERPPDFDGVNRNAEQVHAAALDWLDHLPPGERVLLYLQTIHPHNPYAPPPGLERRFAGDTGSSIRGTSQVLRDIARGRRATSAADRARLRALYAASVAYNDAEIGRFLDALAGRRPERDVLVMVTSDHGEELFDHDGALHGYTLYEELLRIPLVVWGPGRIRPGETTEVTDHMDLRATLLDLLEVEDVSESDGRSLRGLLEGRRGGLAPRLHFAAADGLPGGAFAVRTGRWKYLQVRGGRRRWTMGLGPGRSWDREYFFDLVADPGEERNLAGTGGVREQWLRGRLRSWVRERLEERASGERSAAPEPLDEETRRRLRALGYLD